MKYVRTKDGIFEDKYVHIKVDKDGYAVMEYKGIFYKPPEKVKPADTIEELCDWFVLRKDGKIYQIYTKEEYAVADLGQYTLAFEWYYGIDTDKGLIYVAKMNEKGELELL